MRRVTNCVKRHMARARLTGNAEIVLANHIPVAAARARYQSVRGRGELLGYVSAGEADMGGPLLVDFTVEVAVSAKRSVPLRCASSPTRHGPSQTTSWRACWCSVQRCGPRLRAWASARCAWVARSCTPTALR